MIDDRIEMAENRIFARPKKRDGKTDGTCANQSGQKQKPEIRLRRSREASPGNFLLFGCVTHQENTRGIIMLSVQNSISTLHILFRCRFTTENA